MDNNKLIKIAKERYEIASESWNNFFKESRDVLKFVGGDQWDMQLRNNRENAGIPTLTVNSLPTFIRQITNESRQNCPSIQIDPKDGDADQETAEIFADLIRGIEQASDASTAYDTASWYGATTGLGFFRVISEYESEKSFNQKLVIKAIDDPETVLMDPNHRNIDGSDSEYCFILSTLTKDEYQREFGESKLAKDSALSGWSTSYSNWIRENEVVIAEYYYKNYKQVTLYQVYNTQTMQTIESIEKPSEELLESGLLIILNTRPTQELEIKWCKINDIEVLEETVWPGKYIPVIAVKGDELWVAGKREIKGAVKDAIDSQRAFNYFFSLQAELLSLAPKSPYIGEIRQFSNFEHLWRDANVAPSAYLPYNAVTENGSPLPPPMRQTAEVPIQAAMSLCAQARDNIKAVFGVFDASMGAQGNEHSGVAILARTNQSHTTTYHFYDNLVKAISQCGKILVESIPTFYGDERTVQLIKRNGQSSTSTINGDTEESRDMTNGSYGVVVETGPSYASRRQDSVAHMIALGGAYPQAMPLIADLIASESDWPGAKQIAARLRLALPPEIQQQEAANGQGITKEQQAAMAIAQVKALTVQVQQLQQHLQDTVAQNQEGHTLLKNAMEENKLLKIKSSVDLEKINQDTAIKREQMMLDESEMELSYKIKLRELALQEKSMKIEEAKLAIDVTESLSDIDKEMHNRNIEHHTRMLEVASTVPPIKQDFNGVNPEGLDKSFETLSGPNTAR